MDHVVKPRCRYVTDEKGQAVGWLVHGLDRKAYSVKSIDNALNHWFFLVLDKLLGGAAAA